MSNALSTLTSTLANRLGMGEADPRELIGTLKATAFRTDKEVTDAQMTALLVVANKYELSPWTREIFAFPDKGGIVPVVSVDGWARIINSHPAMDGLEFIQDDTSCTCIIYRKDRSHAIKITEYMVECVRPTQPWKSHPYRMLRHKALIQCARIAFGFAGIYDQDEAERIIENQQQEAPAMKHMGAAEVVDKKPAALPNYPQDQFDKNIAAWRKAIADGKKKPEEIIAMVSTKGTLTDEQKKTISAAPAAKQAERKQTAAEAADPATGEVEAPYTYAQIADKLEKATTLNQLYEAADLIHGVSDETQHDELESIVDRREAELRSN